MKAIILAAGMGTRLHPLTEATPKSLVEVCGRPMLHHQLESLRRAGISECVLVVGYRADQIRSQIGTDFQGMSISYVNNEIYHRTNNLYSLWLARQQIAGLSDFDGETLLLEGDLIFEYELLSALVNRSARDVAIVDRFQSHMDGTVIQARHGVAQAMILKSDQGIDFDYSTAFKTVNIYKFSPYTWRNLLIPELSRYVAEGKTDRYYEAVISDLIAQSRFQMSILEAAPIKWGEVDSVEDLALAEELFGADHSLVAFSGS